MLSVERDTLVNQITGGNIFAVNAMHVAVTDNSPRGRYYLCSCLPRSAGEDFALPRFLDP